MNVYGIKMAGVFMLSTSTILLRSAIVPRWIAFLGYGLGAILLLSIGVILWIPLVFPLWVFLSVLPYSLRIREGALQLALARSCPKINESVRVASACEALPLAILRVR